MLPRFVLPLLLVVGVLDVRAQTPAPPPPARLTVDAGRVVRTVDPRIFGVNTALWDTRLGTAQTRSLLTAAGVRSLRYPGGSVADDYDWQSDRSVTNATFRWANPFPTFAAQAAALGAQAFLTVNYGSGTPEQAAAWVAYANGDPADPAVIGSDAQGRSWGTVGEWAALRAARPLAMDDGFNFLRVGRAAGWGFRYWEVGNEPYGDWEHDEHGTTFPGAARDPATYARNFALFRAKMRAVDPSIKVGAVATASPDDYGDDRHPVTNPRDGSVHTGWTPAVLAALRGVDTLPDFLTVHDCPQTPGQEDDADLLAAASTLPVHDAATLRQMLADYVGSPAAAGIELALTELRTVRFNPGKQSTSLVGGLFLAETMASLAATEFDACAWWDLRNGSLPNNNNSGALYGWRPFGDNGLLASGDRADTPANTPYPSYHAFALLARWAAGGDRVVAAASNDAALTVHAALRASGDLCLLVVNRSSSTARTARVTLGNFVPGASTATTYQYGPVNDASNVGPTVASLAGVGSQFTATFPAYSVTVIELPGDVTSASITR